MLKRVLLVISVLLLGTAGIAPAAIDFIYPGPNTAVTSSGHLIFRLNQADVTTIRITHNGLAGDPVEVGSP